MHHRILMHQQTAAILCFVVAGCGEGGPPLDVKSPYPPYSASTRASYVLAAPGGKKVFFSSRVAGEKSVAGKSMPRVRVTNPDDEAAGHVEFYGNLLAPSRIEVGGGEYNMSGSDIAPIAAALGVPTSASLALDAPLTVDFDVPIGVPQTVEVKGTAILGENGQP